MIKVMNRRKNENTTRKRECGKRNEVKGMTEYEVRDEG
jgi:hypothetical protein